MIVSGVVVSGCEVCWLGCAGSGVGGTSGGGVVVDGCGVLGQ